MLASGMGRPGFRRWIIKGPERLSECIHVRMWLAYQLTDMMCRARSLSTIFLRPDRPEAGRVSAGDARIFSLLPMLRASTSFLRRPMQRLSDGELA